MAAGPEIFGKYHLLDKIATGGMAVVYRAKSYGVAGFEKTLVIKKILPNLANDKSFIEMFIDEAKIASALSHINIVQIFDLGEENGEYFIAMEFVDGVDLKTLLDRASQVSRPLAVNLGAYIVTEVAKGLDYAHRRKDGNHQELGIVHRDVSPHNVLISYAGEVKITDFGIARAKSRITHTRSGIIRGKFAYMSPEQARGEAMDRRSDIFALGIVLWEILTGLRLFKAKNDLETLKRVQTLECVPPSRHNPEINEELDRIILKALTRDLDRRYDSGAELYEDLSAYLFSAGEKVGPTELSDFMQKVLEPDDDDDRSTDFDQFVTALDGLESPSGSVVVSEDVIDLPTDEPQRLPSQEPTVSAAVVRAQLEAEEEAKREIDARDAREVAQGGQDNDEDENEPELSLPVLSDDDDDDFEDSVNSNMWEVSMPSAESAKADSGAEDAGSSSVSVTEDDATIAKASGTGSVSVRPPERISGTKPVAKQRPSEAVVKTGEIPFVGRNDEIKQLRKLLGHVARGDGQLIALEGVDGIGKTRVLQELKKLAEDLGVAVYQVGATQERTAVPYAVVCDILRMIVGASATDSPEVLRARIERLAQLGLSEAERQFVGALFGLSHIGSVVTEATGSRRARSILQVFDKILRGIASERSLILIVDDLESADELSRRALDHVSVEIGSVPLVILVAAAAEPSDLLPKAYEKGEMHEIRLQELPMSARKRLIASLVKAREIPESVIQKIDQAAAGNPLHIVEATRFLIGSGQLQLQGERVTLEGEIEVPDGLDALAQEAFSSLPSRQKRLLGVLGMWGERFSDDLLHALSGVDGLPDDAEDSAAGVVSVGFLRPQPGGYTFSHRLYRRAAAELGDADDARTAAEVLVGAANGRTEFHPVLHDLWLAAGDSSRAWYYLERASELLLKEGAGGSMTNVTRHFQKRTEDSVTRARAALLLSELATAGGETEKAKTALDMARELAETTNGAGAHLELTIAIERAAAERARLAGDPSLAAQRLEYARDLLRNTSSEDDSTSSSLALRRELTDIEIRLARVWRESGQLDRALRRCREAMAGAEELREAPILGPCHEEMARIHERLDETDRAIRQWNHAILIWKKIGRRRALQGAFQARGLSQLAAGDTDHAKQDLREALELARECCDVEAISRARHYLGRVHFKNEEYNKAQSLFAESLEDAERFNLPRLERLNLAYLSLLKAFTGEVQESIRELEQLVTLWERDRPDKLGLLQVELLLGNAYKLARRVGPTNKHYVRALQLARELHLPRYVREITEEMKEAF